MVGLFYSSDEIDRAVSVLKSDKDLLFSEEGLVRNLRMIRQDPSGEGISHVGILHRIFEEGEELMRDETHLYLGQDLRGISIEYPQGEGRGLPQLRFNFKRIPKVHAKLHSGEIDYVLDRLEIPVRDLVGREDFDAFRLSMLPSDLKAGFVYLTYGLNDTRELLGVLGYAGPVIPCGEMSSFLDALRDQNVEIFERASQLFGF